MTRILMLTVAGGIAFLTLAFTNPASAQDRSSEEPKDSEQRERQLNERIRTLEDRLASVESRLSGAGVVPVPALSNTAVSTPQPAAAIRAQPATPLAAAETATAPPDSPSLPGFLAGTTINGYLDGYYGYTFSRPIGRVNLLRANDVLANNFTLNQADIVVERAPDASAGRRLGFRLDLMFGQNTETLQGSSSNEPRPQVYRNIFQAYGSYVLPIGSGLQVDFGKFASSFGYETNWAKDQFNYSRSYSFDFLPFYHMGLRTNYKVSDKVSFQYWLVNGANQSEDFNGPKSNAFLFTLTPNKNISWNVNYFVGNENRDLQPAFNPGIPLLPTQPGLSLTPVYPRPNGLEHIFDTYASWNATSKLAFIGEGDYVVSRTLANSYPARVIIGAAYTKYQFTGKFNLAGRFEYLDDRGGLFSGTTQALKEFTATATYQPVNGFQMRTEFRRDFSNQRFFLTSAPGQFKREQDSATLGLLWWFGGKQGSW